MNLFPQELPIDIIVIHGMGRTPLSMLILRQRLRAAGFNPRLFGYSPTFESFRHCAQRLIAHVSKVEAHRPYALVGHSLGTVLIRAILPDITDKPPSACFFLAPPSQVCRAARYFADNPLYKLLMGEMGQLLADETFMASLPVPQVPVRIYAGTAGPTGRFSPFGDAPNDGILTVAETQGGLAIKPVLIPSTHTFIMNSRLVAADIAATLPSR
jgi:hypothetical protein